MALPVHASTLSQPPPKRATVASRSPAGRLCLVNRAASRIRASVPAKRHCRNDIVDRPGMEERDVGIVFVWARIEHGVGRGTIRLHEVTVQRNTKT